MDKIAQFERVSQERFALDFRSLFPGREPAPRAWEEIILPHRATAGSAGYDFRLPMDICLAPGEGLTVPTGLRVQMEPGWVLMLFPRSGLGFRYRLQMDNTVGVVDADYYFAENEGHILCRITNDSRQGKTLELQAGDAFAQGVFLPFGITLDDEAKGRRQGGFGSTGP